MRPANEPLRQDSFHFRIRYSSKNIPPNDDLTTSKPKSVKKKVSLYSVVLSLLYIGKIRKNIKRRKYREKLIEEWYQTQLSYCFDLSVTINSIKKPMELNNIINKEQSAILFPQIDAMLQISQKMVKALSNARNLSHPYKNRLGKQLYEFVFDYRIYGSYFRTHSKRLQLVSDILNSGDIQLNKFKEIELGMQAEFAKSSSKKEGMTIKDCMDQPLYRLFKYIILLKEYSNRMGKFHPDYESIKKCQALFHDINNNNNNMMKKMEEKEKLKKLGTLFGQNVRGDDRQLIAQMEARTVYFKVRLYVFTDCLVVTKIEQFYGSEKEERFAIYEINQFSYISSPPNLKYFKNIVIMISKQHCVHLFFNEEDSKIEFMTCIQKIVRQIRVWNHQNRRIPKKYVILQKRVSSSSSSSEKQIKFVPIEPELRVEVVGFQVRSTGALSSNSVYVIRFMLPLFYEDEATCLEDEEKYLEKQCMKNFELTDKNFKNHRGYEVLQTTQTSGNSDNSQKNLKKGKIYSIHQRIQMNYSLLEELYDHMQTLCAQRIPELDPLTKDINFFSKGTKKTKFYEVRKFLIEEFFNFSLRQTSILSHPSWFLSKMRINQNLWSYAVRRSGVIKEINSNTLPKSYGFDHCDICQNARIRSIEQFEYLRDQFNSGKNYRQNKDEKSYCFNFFNLLKQRFQYLNLSNFNTTQRILAYFHYLEGRLDYPFLIHHNKDKHIKLVKIFLPSIDQRCTQVQVDQKTTVGQIIDELGNMLHMKNCFDFDLMATNGQSHRILDRDEFLMDVIKVHDISCQQISVSNNVVKKKFTFNFFSTLSSLLQTTPNQNKIYFMKTIYLNKSIEIKSFIAYPEKLFLEIEKIYWTIKKGVIKLTLAQFVQRIAHLCCLKQFANIKNSQIVKSCSKLIQKAMPDEYAHIFHYEKDFKIEVLDAIERQRVSLVQNERTMQYLQFKILEASYEKIGHRTYYIIAQSKQIPGYFTQNMEIPDTVLLGVNYKSLVVARNESNATVLFTLPIGEIQYQISVFSIFITYQTWNLRFDSKMLHHFGELIKKYQTVLTKFQQHMV